jgi:hypothetical protein
MDLDTSSLVIFLRGDGFVLLFLTQLLLISLSEY